MYTNVSDVFEEAAKISDELERKGNQAAADEIKDTLRTFWTTSTEALGELRTSLGNVLPQIESDNLREKITQLQKGCSDLMHLA